jgi:phthalate 4,5-cis-dihydrodiol dehydrogenase
MTAGTRTLNLGIAGLGLAGSGMVAPAVSAMPDVNLVAASDLNPRALEAFGATYGGRTFASVEELCADPGIDVVWVATPNLLHCQHSILAMEHGKHVIVEKPMALNLDEAQSMIDAAARNGVQLICGGSRSSSAVVRKMRELVVAGVLGPLRAMTSWAATDWMLRPRRPDEYDVTKGGGVAFRQAPHAVDSVRLLAGGRVKSVRGVTGAWMKARDTAPGFYSAILEFEGGAFATLVYDAHGYFMASELFDAGTSGPNAPGMDGRVAARREISGNTRDETAAKERLAADRQGLAGGGRSPYLSDLGLLVVSCERGEMRQSPGGLYVYREDGTAEVALSGEARGGMPELSELRTALFDGKPALHDGPWGMATLEVCLAIMQSGQEHRDVVMKHQVAVPGGY